MTYLHRACRSPGCVQNPTPGSRHCQNHGIATHEQRQSLGKMIAGRLKPPVTADTLG
ncbi:hypothetical protein [Mycolicibacterium confluentis]|uniref:Uncharacterized protein n=1 Tax=Mycolicibacterium confluentis TaxID=28047 RepID=A0A7I7XT25_9MYCO|nr:hypothetical protein [Mycolicibacterium confluentis]MCV7321118.1 hypothetical protein [Mycolicibacterium confluentis]BBZ32406.1 hypothetical protein MCNF_10110 [Mycolicibacterium confluentis]